MKANENEVVTTNDNKNVVSLFSSDQKINNVIFTWQQCAHTTYQNDGIFYFHESAFGVAD